MSAQQKQKQQTRMKNEVGEMIEYTANMIMAYFRNFKSSYEPLYIELTTKDVNAIYNKHFHPKNKLIDLQNILSDLESILYRVMMIHIQKPQPQRRRQQQKA